MAQQLEDLVIKFSADTSGVVKGAKDVENALSSVQNTAEKFEGQFEHIFGRVVEFMVARSIVKGALDIGEAIDEIGKAAQRVGESVENFSRLAYAAHQSGISTDQLETSIRGMQRALGNATNSQALTDSFNALGINVQKIINLPASQQLQAIADGFKRIKDPVETTRIATELFTRSGTQMIPVLQQGGQALRDLMQAADDTGATVRTGAYEAIKQFKEGVEESKDKWLGFTAALAQNGTIEILTKTINVLSDAFLFLARNISTSITAYADFLGITEKGSKMKLASSLEDDIAEARAKKKTYETFLNGQPYQKGIDQQDLIIRTRLNSLANLDQSINNPSQPALPGINAPGNSSGRNSSKEQEKSLQSDINRLLKESETTQEKIQTQMNEVNKLLSNRVIGQETYDKIMTGLQKKMDEANRSLDTMENKAKDIANTFFSDIGSAIEKAFTKGGGGAKAMWKSFEEAGIKALFDVQGALLKSEIMKLFGVGGGDKSVKGIGDLFVSALGGLFGGKGKTVYSAADPVGPFLPSFADGGYTGTNSGGGVDGRGGFNAILHPDENVFNRSQMNSLQSMRGSVPINNNIVIQATSANDIDRRLMASIPLITDHVTNAVLQNMNSGGSMSRAIQRRI